MASAQGKTVIVTGAAGGLGKAIADGFLAAGANVVVCDVHPQRLASVEEEWSKPYAGKILTRQTDVSDEAAVQNLVDAAVAKFGRLDVLVNNAGIMDDLMPVGACSKELWDRVLAVNLNGPFLASKAAIGQFEKQQPAGGVIINISSIAADRGSYAGAPYTVSKAGLVALTKSTAGFYGDKGISTVALLLGSMATNIAEGMEKRMHVAMGEKMRALMPARMEDLMVPVESVAKYCLFLTDKDIAPRANGSCITFSSNWPEA